MSTNQAVIDRARASLKDRATQVPQQKSRRPPAHYRVQEIVYFEGGRWYIFAAEWGGDNRFLSVNDWVYSLKNMDQADTEKFVTETKLNELTK